jgi:hypothetical protein
MTPSADGVASAATSSLSATIVAQLRDGVTPQVFVIH